MMFQACKMMMTAAFLAACPTIAFRSVSPAVPHRSFGCLFSSASLVTDGPSAEMIAAIVDTYRKDHTKAHMTFMANSVLTDGLYCHGKIRNFSVAADEPEALGGTNEAPNPVEMILFTLASCQQITYKAYANAMGIPLKSVEVELKGEIDFRGFFAVSKEARPGYHKITGTVTLYSPGSDRAILEKLQQAVEAHCPVADMINVPTELELVVKE